MGILHIIKHGSKVSDFELMMEKVKPEDTIQFEKGEYFIPDTMQFKFDINVGFKGATENPEDVKLHARFLLKDNAAFYMENMTIVTPEGDAGLTLRNKKVSFFKNCIFESETERPIIHGIGADVYLQKCVIRNNLNHKGILYAEGKTTVTLIQSSIDMAVITDNSQLNASQSLIISSLIVKQSSFFSEDYTIVLNYDRETYGIVTEDVSLVRINKVICPEEDLRVVAKDGTLKIDELEFTNNNKLSIEMDNSSVVVIEDNSISPEK